MVNVIPSKNWNVLNKVNIKLKLKANGLMFTVFMKIVFHRF